MTEGGLPDRTRGPVQRLDNLIVSEPHTTRTIQVHRLSGHRCCAVFGHCTEPRWRRTEARLRRWFVPAPIHLRQKLDHELFLFLAQFGRTPSAKMRISVLKDAEELTTDTREDQNDRLVDRGALASGRASSQAPRKTRERDGLTS